MTVTLGNLGNFDAISYGGSVTSFHSALINDFVYDINSNIPTSSSPATFSINHLISGQTYDVYLYAQNGGYNNVKANFTVGGSTLPIDNSLGSGAAFVSGANYLLYSNVVATGGSISGSFVSTQNANFGSLDGFQIRAVPEPGSFALFAFGIAGLFVYRFRGQRATKA